MYITRRQCILIGLVGTAVLAAAAAAFLLLPPDKPTWTEIRPQLEIDYVPKYTEGPSISARTAVLLESLTGTILYAHNENEKRPPASTTKIMTALLALESGRPDDLVTVSTKAAATRGSSAQLRAGQKLSLEDALHGLLLRSGNDAAVAIAEHIAGSETRFVQEMNSRARELGARGTQFQNPHGIDAPGHYSTAFDLALLARLALKFPEFAEIVGKKEYLARLDSHTKTWRNTNRLLWSFDGCEGVKTGTTRGAGNCLVAAASRDGRQLISVVLGSSNRWADSARLLEYGFDQFHLLTFAAPGQTLAEVGVVRGMQPSVAAEPLTRFAYVVRKEDVDDIRTRLVTRPLRAPVRKRQEIGRLHVYLHDTEIGQLSLHAAHSVPVRTPIRVFWEWLRSLPLFQWGISGH